MPPMPPMHDSLTSLVGAPPPAQLPAKSRFKSTVSSPELTEDDSLCRLSLSVAYPRRRVDPRKRSRSSRRGRSSAGWKDVNTFGKIYRLPETGIKLCSLFAPKLGSKRRLVWRRFKYGVW